MVHVLKFGGTSMANATNMLKVISIVQQSLSSDKTVVVVSALSLQRLRLCEVLC